MDTHPKPHAGFTSAPRVALGCGGTGGHFFPGLAVAEQLRRKGCAVKLFVSAKDVDQHAARSITDMQVVTLPAVGLQNRRVFSFAAGLLRSYRLCRREFRTERPQAALAMGGFTSVPPVLAAKRLGAATFLHESNTIPGRANRWLSRFVDTAFIGFPAACAALHCGKVLRTGTPVRPEFQPLSSERCRAALGLEPSRPVLLVMGGSQGASGINELVIRALPRVVQQIPRLQCVHLSGPKDLEKVTQAYLALKLMSVVRPFFAEMQLALGAATAALSRAGASSLAELAAMRLPALLIPYPVAADNHQFFNARAFVDSGAALLLEQKSTTPETLADRLVDLLGNEFEHQKIRRALSDWHAPNAAEEIADNIMSAIAECGSIAQGEEVRNSPWKQHRSAMA